MLLDWVDTVQNLDCLTAMKELPGKSIDLVVADPPYNLSKGAVWTWDATVKLDGFGGPWKKTMQAWDDMSLAEYWSFTEAWVSEAKRLLKPTGSIWVCGTYHNMGIVNVVFQKLGIEIINEVVWYKRNAFPNLACRRLTASHETLLWGHAGGKKRQYFFDYKAMKNGDFPEDLLRKPGTQMRTVWDIPNNKTREELRFGTHPTQKPLRLCARIIRCCTRADDLCLVPFAGTGSECIAAKTLGRHFIGFEIDPEYARIAEARLHALDEELEQLILDLS